MQSAKIHYVQYNWKARIESLSDFHRLKTRQRVLNSLGLTMGMRGLKGLGI